MDDIPATQAIPPQLTADYDLALAVIQQAEAEGRLGLLEGFEARAAAKDRYNERVMQWWTAKRRAERPEYNYPYVAPVPSVNQRLLKGRTWDD